MIKPAVPGFTDDARLPPLIPDFINPHQVPQFHPIQYGRQQSRQLPLVPIGDDLEFPRGRPQRRMNPLSGKEDEPYWRSRDMCSLPLDPGPCRAIQRMWFYNPATSKCQPFIYTGCRGNGNRFESRRECMTVCRGKYPDEMHRFGILVVAIFLPVLENMI